MKPNWYTEKDKVKGATPSVALINPKFAHNVGTAIRACSCWGFDQLWWTGDRVDSELESLSRIPREERMKGYSNVQLIKDDRFFDRFGNVTPVAIEVRENSESLVDFEHPENPLYVFGPEDGSIPKLLLRHCHRFVVIPTKHCLNLACAVNIVMYDRYIKRCNKGLETPYTTSLGLNESRGNKSCFMPSSIV